MIRRPGTPARSKPRLRLNSSFRVESPEKTLALAKALALKFGISRVSEVTRMDRLGLPVFCSIRPRGQTLRVHAGKGLSPDEARVGAWMEALEYAVAEPANSAWTMRPVTAAELAVQLGPGARLIDLVPALGVVVAEDRRIEAVECEELRSGRKVMLPAEVVFVPFEPSDAASLFGWTSNGLASGNSLEEATLHALLEVLERDAVSMNKPADASQWVDPGSLPQPLADFASTWRALGIALAVRHVPNEFALPCFEACLHEPESGSVDLAGGWGLHPDRGIALTRAVCEAAQSRLSHIHGGREDITGFYATHTEWKASTRKERQGRLVSRMFDERRRIEFDAVPHDPCEGASLPEVLDRVLDLLAGAGFATVYRHRFAAELGNLHVVKVVVPKCEQFEPDSRRIGPRLLARIIGNA